MVDRVAQAILDAINAPSDEPPSGVLGMDSGEVDCRKLARAAIEAMRMPTGAMYEAVSNCGLMWRDNNSTQIWQLMIGGALGETQLSLDNSKERFTQ